MAGAGGGRGRQVQGGDGAGGGRGRAGAGGDERPERGGDAHVLGKLAHRGEGWRRECWQAQAAWYPSTHLIGVGGARAGTGTEWGRGQGGRVQVSRSGGWWGGWWGGCAPGAVRAVAGPAVRSGGEERGAGRDRAKAPAAIWPHTPSPGQTPRPRPLLDPPPPCLRLSISLTADTRHTRPPLWLLIPRFWPPSVSPPRHSRTAETGLEAEKMEGGMEDMMKKKK